MKRLALLCALMMLRIVPAWAQADYDMSPSASMGKKALGSYFDTDIDSVNLANGNLMINLPVFGLPGRELPLHLSVAYNNRSFEKRYWTDEFGTTFWAWAYYYWRRDSGIGGDLTATRTFVSNTSNSVTWDLKFYWVEKNGSKHQFTTRVTQACTLGYFTGWQVPCQGPVPFDYELYDNRTVDVTDSEFVRIETGNYFNTTLPTSTPGVATVRLKDGTVLNFKIWRSAQPGAVSQQWEVMTLNGNRLVSNNLAPDPAYLPTSDTLGRSVSFSGTAGVNESYTMQDSNGVNKTYQVVWGTVTGRTPPNDGNSSFTAIRYVNLPNGKFFQFDYDSNGMLSKITYPSGGYVRYLYAQFQLTPWPNPTWEDGWRVQNRIVSADGTAASEKTWTYSYSTSSYTTVTAPDGTYVRHWFGNGFETVTQYMNAAGTELERIDRIFTPRITEGGVNKDYRITEEKTTIGSLIRKTTYSYDDYNNVTSQVDYDFGSGAPGGVLRTVSKAYVTSTNYTGAHILNRLSTEHVYNPDNSVALRTEYEYDNYTAQPLVNRTGTIPGWADPGSTIRANATAIKRWLTGTTFLTTGQQFDVLGNVVKVTDPAGHTTETTFDDRFTDSINRNTFAYPTRSKDTASGFYTDTTYDFKTGLPKIATDSLSRTTTTTYDLMNRPTQTNYPNTGFTRYIYDDLTPAVTKEILVDNLGNLGRKKTVYDKLYREIQTETSDPEGNIFLDTQYDGNGRKWKVSNPRRAAESQIWSTFEYDGTNRPTRNTAQDGSTVQYGYSGNVTTVIDEAGNARRYTYDGVGRMTKVEEPNPTLDTPLVTTYSYNAIGKMTQSNQGGQIRTWVFDPLGRTTSQALPESGTTTFTYNTDSLLLTKTDARNITTTMTYHATQVHQAGTRSYLDGTPTVSFNYNAQGLRTSMTDGLGTVTYAYDPNTDKPTQESRTLAGITGTFTTGFMYNIKGDLKSMTYPSGRVVNFNYAAGGGCCNSRLASTVDQTTSTTVNSSITYNAAGETTSNILGNGVAQTYSYNGRLQLSGITASLGVTNLMNFAYDYGTSTTNTGRVLSRTDSIQSEHSMKYTYDAIYRLSQVVSNDASSSLGIAWTFDIWGNRLTQTPQGLATSKIGTQTLGYTNNRNTAFTYDAAGNQTNDGTHNYTFNAENQITQMDGRTATYVYDGDGRRMKKAVGSETIYYFYGPGGLLCEFTTTNTGATQANSTNRTTYRTSDKLGSAVLTISAAGTVIENNRTLPYGEAWLSEVASTNDKKFTTYQRDQESGLDYAMNRYYANLTGRFVSSDPFRGSGRAENPSSLNRYVYVENDPVNSVDPDGLIASCPRGTRWNAMIGSRSACLPIFGPDDRGKFAEISSLIGEMEETAQQKREFAFNKNVRKERKKAGEKLANADADCAQLFSDLGLSLGDVGSELSDMDFQNGTTSTDLIQDIVSPAYANATGTTGWSVPMLFLYGFPPLPSNQRIDGWSPAGGTAYLRPSSVSWSLLVHETLHQFKNEKGNLTDDFIKAQWGISASGSSGISDKIKEKCN